MSVDMTGRWVCTSANTIENELSVSGSYLDITKQYGMVYTGEMERVDGSVSRVCGSCLGDTINGYATTLVSDGSTQWTVSVKGDTLIMALCGMSKGSSELMSVEYVFTRSGDQATLPEAEDVKGMVYTSTNTVVSENNMSSKNVFEDYTLVITEQNKRLYRGYIISGSDRIDIVGYMMGTTMDSCTIVMHSDAYGLMNGDLYREGDKISITLFNTSNAQKYVTIIQMEDSEKSDYDVCGHWNAISVESYLNDSYSSIDNWNDNNTILCDMDIYSVDRGLFYGSVYGSFIVGSYVDNILRVDTTVNNGSVKIIARFYNSETMYMSSVYHFDNGTISSSAIVLSKSYLQSAEIKTMCPDISGDWKSVSSEMYDGNMYVLEGVKLHIDSYVGNVFHGQMEQYRGTETMTVNIVGSMRPIAVGVSNRYYGSAVDDGGNIWSIIISDGYIVFNVTCMSDSGVNEGEVCSVERVYTRSGTESLDLKPVVDLSNTDWVSISCYEVRSDGTFREENSKYVLNFHSQDGFLFNGICRDEGYGGRSGTFCGYVLHWYNPSITILSDYRDGVTDSGYGWIGADGHLRIIEFFTYTGGIYSVCITEFVQSTV